MQFKRAVLSDTLKLYTEKLMLRTPLGACNDNGGNGLPQPFRRLRNDKKLVILNAKREKIRNTIKGLS